LKTAWSAVPAAARRHPDLVAVYARQLLRLGAPDEGAELLAATLERAWDERLVLLYGETPGAQPDAQLETAEEWRVRHGESAALLLTLGRLARRNRLTDRARGYLEKSISLKATPEAHAELGLLFEAAGNAAQALHHGREALERCQDLHQPSH
jgi:HemY protein